MKKLLMKKLFAKLKEKKRKLKILNKDIALILEVTEGMVSNYLNLVFRIPFPRFIKLVNLLYEDTNEIDDILIEFSLNTTKHENILEAAEWFYNNGKIPLLNRMIEVHKDNPLMMIYKLLVKRINREISVSDFYLEVEKSKEIDNHSIASRALIRIATLNAFLGLRCYSMISLISDEALKLIKEIENEYVRDSFKYNVYDCLALSELKQGNIDKAEEIAKLIIDLDSDNNKFAMSVNYMLHLLSEIYVFQDYEKSIYYNKLSLEHFKQNELEHHKKRQLALEATHDFIKIHHKKFEGLFLSDPSEEAHFYAKMGGEINRQKAIQILNEIESKYGELSPHQLYYKSLATMELSDIEISLDKFINNGDRYYAALPKNLMKSILPS